MIRPETSPAPALELIFPFLKAGRIPHTVLLTGVSAPERSAAAKLLSAALVCESKSKPCLACAPCRKAMAAAHPDIVAADSIEGRLPVEEVRRLRNEAYIRPGEADRKIFIFAAADALSPACQNALLKVLEEPPAGVHFLLFCENAGKLLPTVRSRAVKISLSPEDAGVLSRFAAESPAAKAPPALRREEKGAAKREQEETAEAASFAAAFTDALCRGSELSLLEAAKGLEKLPGEEHPAVFSLLRQLCRDAAAFGAGLAAEPLPPALSGLPETLGRKFPAAGLSALADLFGRLAGRCEFHAGAAALTAALAAESALIKQAHGV